MKLTILTTVTNPEERQDPWVEALKCYLGLADEVVVVNGGSNKHYDFPPFVKCVDLAWPYEWNWVEYPRHLNFGKQHCTGDWILRLDIDQFIHEKDFDELRKRLEEAPDNVQAMTMQKMSFTYGGKYYQKGEAIICIRNLPTIAFGKETGKDTDLCFPIIQTGTEVVYDGDNILYELPIGRPLEVGRTGVSYWNYDYYFKTLEFTTKEFFRMSRAYHRYYDTWKFGDSEKKAFIVFCNMLKARNQQSSYIAEVKDHPKYIQDKIKNITPEQFGHSAWGLK